MNAPVAVLLLFAALGAVDEALGGKLGVAPAFRNGLAAMGPLCLSMAGIYSVAVSALSGMAGQGGSALPFDAALPAGLVLAPDMGGWAIAQALAATPQLAAYAGLLVASTLGCLVSFVLPASLGALQSHEVMGFMQGVLWGVVALPAGLLLGGAVLGLAPGVLLQNLWPVALLCAVLCLALRFAPRGCLRVSARPTPEGGYVCQAEPVRLGPVQWALVEADLDGVEQLDVVETRLAAALEAAAEATPPGCEALIARLRLCGRTGLDTLLRDPTHQTDLIERLEALQTATPGVWIKDMQASTSPLLDMEAALAREDLLGEVLRLAQNLEDQPEALAALADTALAPLYGHGQLRKLLSPVDAANRRALLEEARRLCTDLLEAR